MAPVYFEDYHLLYDSGLYKKLTDTGMLLKHEEINAAEHGIDSEEEGKIILPEQIPFISYPYEWSFDMWKDAALLTLSTATAAIEKGMVLKDATPFNVQFYKGKPVWIDTLSFTKYNEGTPWIAYRQFCECMLGPLLLMHYCHRDAAKIFLSFPDGIPLEVLITLLPKKTKWNLHIYLHIWFQAKIKGNAGKESKAHQQFSKQKMLLLLKGLQTLVKNTSLKKSKSVWDDYYTDTILGEKYLSAKKELVASFADKISFETVADLGANDGVFSLLLKDKAKHITAADADSNCINHLYLQLKKEGIKNIIPVVSELNHPSPAIGWANKERDQLADRIQSDLVLALALVHHLAIAANIPLNMIADWLSEISRFLIIEFIPQEDEKVKQLLAHRENIFTDYSLPSFKNTFSGKFDIMEEQEIGETGRRLFLMKRK